MRGQFDYRDTIGGVEGHWQGRGPDIPWYDLADPFVLEGDDAEYYPPETPAVLAWIKERRQPSFSRPQAGEAAARLGLSDYGDRPQRKRKRGLMSRALNCLEVFDYVRSFFPVRKGRENLFIVSPKLLVVDADPEREWQGQRNFTSDQKRELWFAAGGRCCICRVRLGPDWHADHVVPWSKGGPTTVENGAALCPTCNHRKHAKMDE